jgi:hypothetical protein
VSVPFVFSHDIGTDGNDTIVGTGQGYVVDN